MKKRIAIIGAGPIGLEAALAARAAEFEVTVYERGDVADSVKRWGHIRMFSPFHMNASPEGRGLLENAGAVLPGGDAYLTGAEYAATYLEPLARHLPVRAHTKVKAIVRDRSGKRDSIGEPERSDTSFRLLVEENGIERHDYADVVLDCGGVFQNPNPLGDGGIPALGESAAGPFVRYGVGAVGDDLGTFAGKRVVVVGAGHSAANLIVALTELKEHHPATQIHWIIRRPGPVPCELVADDPLKERHKICAAANDACAAGLVTVHFESTVMALATRDDSLRITLRTSGSDQTLDADVAIAATGFRPDWSPARELHLQTCWATEGTYPLAASLLGEAGGNCLAVPAFGADTLVHPEPDFYALGMKSYGRTPDFLISTGLQQIRSIMEKLR